LLRSEEINWEDITIVDLEVLDEESFPGQVFKGTAESIVNEMKALKPELFTGETLDARSTIVKRAVSSLHPISDFLRFGTLIETQSPSTAVGTRA